MTTMNYSIPLYHSQFPGESFINLHLPNYEWERRIVIFKIFAAVILFFFWLPNKYVFKTVVPAAHEAIAPQGSSEKNSRNSDSRGTRQCRKKSAKSVSKSITSDPQQNAGQEQLRAPLPTIEIDQLKSSLFTTLGIASVFLILFLSPINLFPSRTLLRAPLFTREECDRVISMAMAAASQNVQMATNEREELLMKFPELTGWEKDVLQRKKNATELQDHEGWIQLTRLNSILQSPPGWKKDRHKIYPTTDLNLITDPFTHNDREWLASLFDSRLAPLVERAYGIWRGAIRANDIFVVRYDADEGQNRLRVHTDSSHLSFNVLLNDDFEGGGTRFHHRIKKNVIDIHPEVGETLLSHAMILHEGLPITKGTRYILVGFNSIDKKDPITGEDTKLSIFSSWLNFCWMQVRFREGAARGTSNRRRRVKETADDMSYGDERIDWKDNKYITSLFRDLDNAMTWLADKFAPLRTGKLVESYNFEEYLQLMDHAMGERIKAEHKLGIERSRASGYSSWFRGQNLHLDVFGNYADSWTDRKDAEEKFRSETL